MGKRIFGLVQLSGLNLVPKPPARINAFKMIPILRLQAYIPWVCNKTVSWNGELVEG